MLFSASIIRTVAPFFHRNRGPALVVDPVMVSTSGKPLLQPSARKTLCEVLFPRATLLTPNVHEIEALGGRKVRTLEDLQAAARALFECFGCAILAKGGHLRHTKHAVDVFYDGKHELLLSAAFIRGVKTHGTGCTYSAAITAYLARGFSLRESVRKAKNYVTRAIARSQKASGHSVLHW
jgi:hydroxymethylpyrimidine/phosphomethylpyrimidine kinase